jgi:zinc transport system substrate-binding protein
MNKFFTAIIILLLLIILVLVFKYASKQNGNSQANSAAQNAAGKIGVSASFYPLYYFASEIGGDKASVFNITPAGAEPHDYEPTPKDIAQIDNSKLLILNGAGLESWADKIKPDISSNNVSLVVATQGLALMNAPAGEAAQNSAYDPHLWVNPVTAKKEADNILSAFEIVDPANTNFYAQNAAKLQNQLDILDAEYKNSLQSCQQKSFVTSHAAFGYLAKQYGLTQVPIAGLSPDAEPSAKQLAAISQFAKTNHIKYIFFESLASPKLSQSIADEVGAQTLILNPIEGLTADDIKAGKDYISVMRENLTNLKIALQCQ